MAAVGDGAEGDLVVWLQEHLAAAGQAVAVSGVFGLHTLRAVQAFQTRHRLTADGIVGPETWRALLHYRPLVVHWVHHGRRTVAADDAIGAGAAGARGGPVTLPVPASASLPARRDEIPASLGAGR
jgi:lysozyme family protein